MAFKVRCEFWRLSTTGDGVASVILNEAVADAIEVTAETSPSLDILAALDANGMYAMAAVGITGSATVEVATVPTEDPARGKLVTEGDTQWFLARKGDKLYIDEYV